MFVALLLVVLALNIFPANKKTNNNVSTIQKCNYLFANFWHTSKTNPLPTPPKINFMSHTDTLSSLEGITK